MDFADEVRLLLPPGLAPRLRLHPLLQAPGIAADFTGDELRLTRRGRGGLAALADDIAGVVPVRLHTPTGRPRHARDLALAADISLSGAIRIVLGEGLAHLADNVAGAAAGEVEAVHQARVAIRRLRAGLLLFRPRLDRAPSRRFDERLRHLGHILGGTRDWDVFLDETLPAIAAAFPDEAPWLRRLQAAAEEARAAAREEVAGTLAAPAFTQLVLGLARFIESGGLTSVDHQRFSKLAPALLDRLAKRVRRHGRDVATASGEDLHALRKSLKKLRYGLEFTQSLYAHKPVKTYLQGLKALQEALGGVNDSRVTLDLIGHLVTRRHVEVETALGRITVWSDGRAATALSGALPLWVEFRAVRAPWVR